jgi:hypothetical protein
MSRKIKVMVAWILAALVALAPVSVYAQPVGKITSIKKNQKAPFDGTLFDISAAADLTLRLETYNRQCEIKIGKAKELCQAKCQLEINLKLAELASLTQKHNDILKIKNDQIDFLQKTATRDVPWYKTNKFWLASGIVVGFVMTLGSAYAWGQVAR